MTRTLWPILLAAAITGRTDCGAPSEPDELGGRTPWVEPDYEWDDELGRGTPWLVPDVENIAGRVVSPSGEPLGAMEVELVYPGDPHWPETVAFTSLGDGSAASRQDRLRGSTARARGGRAGCLRTGRAGADRLAAGDYTIAGDDWQCPVTLRPRTHARVAVSRQGCEVEEEPL